MAQASDFGESPATPGIDTGDDLQYTEDVPVQESEFGADRRKFIQSRTAMKGQQGEMRMTCVLPAHSGRVIDLQERAIEKRLEARSAIEMPIIARALADEDFRHELLSNPRLVLERELGVILGKEVKLPDGFSVRIIEETPECAVLVLPPRVPALVTGKGPSDAELDPKGGATYYCTTVTCKPGFSC